MTDKVFKSRIKELREKNNLTQIELTNILKLSHSMVSHYELGIRYPSAKILIELADIFKVSLDYLTCRVEHNIVLDNYTEEEVAEAIDYINFRRQQRK